MWMYVESEFFTLYGVKEVGAQYVLPVSPSIVCFN